MKNTQEEKTKNHKVYTDKGRDVLRLVIKKSEASALNLTNFNDEDLKRWIKLGIKYENELAANDGEIPQENENGSFKEIQEVSKKIDRLADMTGRFLTQILVANSGSICKIKESFENLGNFNENKMLQDAAMVYLKCSTERYEHFPELELRSFFSLDDSAETSRALGDHYDKYHPRLFEKAKLMRIEAVSKSKEKARDSLANLEDKYKENPMSFPVNSLEDFNNASQSEH